MDRNQLQGQNRYDIVLGNLTAERENLYHGRSARTNAAKALLQIRPMCACGKSGNIGIYVKVIAHCFRGR